MTRTESDILIPELEEYARQVEAIKRDATDLVVELSEAQFNWRPEAGRWSIAECLTHLNVTARQYFPLIRAAIEQARARHLLSAGPFRHGFLGNWFVRSLEPPVKRRFKAPKIFVPPPDQPFVSVVPEFMGVQEQLLRFVRDANGVDLARAKVHSPASRLIRISLGQSLALLAAHERRHLWQARQVKDNPRFPL